MSRIGRAPIAIPAGVEVNVIDNNHVTVKGPKGTLEKSFAPCISVAVEGNEVVVTRADDSKESRSLHGLSRTLIHNMIIGVSEGFKKELSVQGVGFRVSKEGNKLVMNIGFSHNVVVEDTDDVKTEAPNANTVIVTGIDKQKVGQFAADVRSKRPPEPYKGKGIRYADEVVRHKEGKTGAK